MKSNLEDMCGNEYDRGLGRVWVCSLPLNGHLCHEGYEWHNINGQITARWTDEKLLGYNSLAGWVDTT